MKIRHPLALALPNRLALLNRYRPRHSMPVVLQALREYGMIVADNGSDWFVSGAPDPRWSNDDLHTLGRVPGSAFEVVDTSSLRR